MSKPEPSGTLSEAARPSGYVPAWAGDQSWTTEMKIRQAYPGGSEEGPDFMVVDTRWIAETKATSLGGPILVEHRNVGDRYHCTMTIDSGGVLISSEGGHEVETFPIQRGAPYLSDPEMNLGANNEFPHWWPAFPLVAGKTQSWNDGRLTQTVVEDGADFIVEVKHRSPVDTARFSKMTMRWTRGAPWWSSLIVETRLVDDDDPLEIDAKVTRWTAEPAE